MIVGRGYGVGEVAQLGVDIVVMPADDILQHAVDIEKSRLGCSCSYFVFIVVCCFSNVSSD